jgi:hypothetical protein
VKHFTPGTLLLRYWSREAGGGLSGITAMTTRRLIYWWFWIVMSGRFLDRFLCMPNAPE